MNENLSSQNSSETLNFDSAFSTTNLILSTMNSNDSTRCYEKHQYQQQYHEDDEINVTNDTINTTSSITNSITATTIVSGMIRPNKKITSYPEYTQVNLQRKNCNDTSQSEHNDYNIMKEVTTSTLSLSSSSPLSSTFSSGVENRDNVTLITTSNHDIMDKNKTTSINYSNIHEPFNRSLLNFVNQTMNQNELSTHRKFPISNTFPSMSSTPVRNLFPNTITNNNTGNNDKNQLAQNKQLDSFLQSQTTLNALSMAYSSLIANGLCGIGKEYENAFAVDNNNNNTTTNSSSNTHSSITPQSDKFKSIIQHPSITNLFKQHSMISTSETASIPASVGTAISPISTAQSSPSSIFLANSLEKINAGNLSNSFIPNINNIINNNNVSSQRHVHQVQKSFLNPILGHESNSCQLNFPAIMNDLLIENLESWQHLQKNAVSSNIDPHLINFYSGSCCPVELTNTNRRKNATRETTSLLKSWLNEHRKNPYPTKGEKIMLALITKMSLTQVSTWFANARRRLKKENKVTWNLRTDCLSDVEHDEQSIENDDIDGDDENDDKVNTNDHDDISNNTNEHNLQGITGLEGLKQYLLSKNTENYSKLSLSKLFDKNGSLQTIIEGNKSKSNNRLRNFANNCDQLDSIPSKRPNLDYDNPVLTNVSTMNPLNQEKEFCTNKSNTNIRLETRKIWSLVDMMNEQNNSPNSRHELFNDKLTMNIQNNTCDNWSLEENKDLQQPTKNLWKTSNESFSYQMKMNTAITDSPDINRNNSNNNINDDSVNRKLIGNPSFLTTSTSSSSSNNNNNSNNSTSSTIDSNIHIPNDSSSLFSPSTLAAFYLYYQQNLQRAQEQNQLITTSLSHQFPLTGHQQKSHGQKLQSLNSPNLSNNNNLLCTKPFLQYDKHFSSLFQGNNALNLNLLNKETQQYARSLCLHKNHSNQQVTTSPSEES
ncbi:unnamed protein product [Schistosoma spindalis]|nr:unnamed protein product [Schistosoma spindale]